MTLEIYTYNGEGPKFDHINEQMMYERVEKKMIENLRSLKTRYCMIVNFYKNGVDYDIIIIKKDKIITVELKGFKGKIIGSDSGPWSVLDENSNKIDINRRLSPFKQLIRQRSTLLNYLNEKLPTISIKFEDNKIEYITNMLCFEEGSSYDFNQINMKHYLWFKLTDVSNLTNEIKKDWTDQYSLKNSDINALLEEMKVKLYKKKVGLNDFGGGKSELTDFVKEIKSKSDDEASKPVNKKLALLGQAHHGYNDEIEEIIKKCKYCWSGWTYILNKNKKIILDSQIRRYGLFNIYVHEIKEPNGSGLVEYKLICKRYLYNPTLVESDEKECTAKRDRNKPHRLYAKVINVEGFINKNIKWNELINYDTKEPLKFFPLINPITSNFGYIDENQI